MKAVSGASKFTMGTKSGTKAGKSLKQKVKKPSPKKTTKKPEKSSKKPKKLKGKKDTNKPKTKAKKKTSPVKAGGKAGKKAKPLKLNLQFFGNKQSKVTNPAKVGKNTGKQPKGNIYDLSQVDLSKWNKGSYNSAGDSAIDHFKRHGHEVGAEDVADYVRKAEGFSLNLKRAKKSRVGGEVDGVIRHKKNGKYIDIAPDKTIISFGKQ